jgi:surface carbohydrate biosynthesis protein (TIGR04326 family)
MPEGAADNPTGEGVTLLVWDAEGPPPVGEWTTVLWRRYADAEDHRVISITQRVEQEADKLRTQYLAWIYDLGESRIDGKRVIDHLSLRPGFSYWWMSSIAQKFNVTDGSHINDAIKALALEMLVGTFQTTSIVLVSGNRRLADCIMEFCARRQLGFELRQTRTIRVKKYRYSLYQSLPQSIRALIYFGWYIWKAMPIFLRKKTAIPMNLGDALFIDILVHLNKRGLDNGSFISNYWTTLGDKLSEWNIKSNWLHVFFRHPTTPTLAKAQWHINRFNATSKGSQFHALVEGFVSSKPIVSALRDYFTLRQSFSRLHSIRNLRPIDSDLNLWPLHAEDWDDTLRGKGAMVNCLHLSLFEEALSCLPTQRVGIYIAENQPWEMALVHAWKTAGHGSLIGTPHTTIRFWDLRYHFDSRTYSGTTDNHLPLPDFLAVNGPVARESIMASGYIANRVVEVEALRFLHLSKPKTVVKNSHSYGNELRVLVCGDFLADTNRRMIAWLKIASASLPSNTIYIFKPHPAYPLIRVNFPAFKIEINNAPLSDLLLECNVVFSSNITSAAVDAYCSGVRVVQMLDGSSFNTSPLLGRNSVTYVRNPIELTEALHNCKPQVHLPCDPYFHLEEDLPRWQRLLNLNVFAGLLNRGYLNFV